MQHEEAALLSVSIGSCLSRKWKLGQKMRMQSAHNFFQRTVLEFAATEAS
jgi:hypothetical protein